MRASRTIYYLVESDEFAVPVGDHQASLMDYTALLFSGVYRDETQVSSAGLESGRQQLSQRPAHTLLQPVSSSDGSPMWSAIVYGKTAGTATTIKLREEHPIHRTHYKEQLVKALHYHAVPPGGPYSWETDIGSGRSGYFLTGGVGISALWRITRIQSDALNRQVLTFAPVQLSPTLAIPLFDHVAPELQPFLKQHFEGFQKAIVHNASFDAIDRANNIAEGILKHCLKSVGVPSPRSLSERLEKARDLLERKAQGFPMTYYGYNLAQLIRQLHARLHENQGKTVRPEVGLNLTVTVSELLVDVGLGKY